MDHIKVWRRNYTIVISFLLTFIISALLVGYIDAKYKPADSVQLLIGNKEHTYQISEFMIFGYDLVNEDTLISNCDDGQLYFYEYKDRIINIVISLNESVDHNVPIVIYYTLENEDFCEEQTCRAELSKGSKNVEIPVKVNVNNIRIDIGNKEGEQFKFDRISINRNSILTSPRLYGYWILLLIVTLVVIYRDSALIVKIRNKIVEFVSEDKRLLSVVFVLTLFIIVFVLYMNYLNGSRGYIFNDIGSDSYFQRYPNEIYTANAIANGIADRAHWNYTSSLGNGSSVFRPTIDNWYLLFGEKYVIYMMGINQVLKVFLAGILFFVYLRMMGISRWTSSIFAICYAFNAHIILRGSWPSYPSEAVLLAMWLCGFEYWRKNKTQWGIFFLTSLLFYWNTGGGVQNCILYFSAFLLCSFSNVFGRRKTWIYRNC